MPEIKRFSGHNDWINLDLVERERIPEPAMKFGIQMHLEGLTLSNTTSILDELGVQRSRKADLQPTSGKTPNQAMVVEL